MSWNEPLSAMDMEPIAAEITRLRRELDQLREALEPFAEHGRALEGCHPTDTWCEAEAPDGLIHWLAVEHFHDATRALDATTPEEEAPE